MTATPSPLARLGRWAHGHRRTVIIAWAVMAMGLGVFAPKLEHALSGAMWEVNGSDSLAARQVIDREFGGMSSQSAAVVLQSATLPASDPAFQERIAAAKAVLATEPAFGPAVEQPGPDGRTVMLQAAHSQSRHTTTPNANTPSTPQWCANIAASQPPSANPSDWVGL
mgnify:CR=1 FL=1